eukprot:361432-Chlamydomonas_euryale.AAC.7
MTATTPAAAEGCSLAAAHGSSARATRAAARRPHAAAAAVATAAWLVAGLTLAALASGADCTPLRGRQADRRGRVSKLAGRIRRGVGCTMLSGLCSTFTVAAHYSGWCTC